MRPAWAFLPAVGGAVVHAPILRFDLVPALKRPLDLGAAPGGTRLVGDNKTFRGALAMSAGTLGASLLLHRAEWYRRRLAPELAAAGPLRHGALLGAAVVLGELPNSALKRRLRIAPGARRPSPTGALLAIHDQADFVLLSWPFLAPAWRMSARELAEAFAVVAGVHVAIDVIGYLLGAREAPL